MKHEKLANGIQSGALAFLLTFGALASMATGLGLNVENMGLLALRCAIVCLLSAALSHLRFGGWVTAAALLGSAVYLLRNEAAMEQTVDMLCRITRYYDNAYGWGVIHSPHRGMGPMDLPLGILAVWIGLISCRDLCRGNACVRCLTLAVLPLIASVVVTDTVPDSRYLYLWLLGLVLVLLSQCFRRQKLRWGVYMVLLAAVPTALALGLLFRAVPRETYDKHPDRLQEQIVTWIRELPELWEQTADEVASRVDGAVQPEQIGLDTLGPRLKRVYPVMEVSAPISGTVYLRGSHYDVYTGTGWAVSAAKTAMTLPADSREMGLLTVSTRRPRDVIYLPYYPEEVPTLTDGRLDNGEGVKQYSFTQWSLFSHWRNVLQSRIGPVEVPWFQPEAAVNSQNVNLRLPAATYAWAVEKVDTILNEESSATAVADAIARYVRGSALYDLDTGKMNREYSDFAQWFLEESETGYCVHFATAAVVLLRAAGVEARYVEGYMFSTVAGEETTVTADQAHAWAEYYEPLLDAWIVLEATPGDSGGQVQTQPPETEAPDTQPELTEPGQGTQPTRSETVPGPTGSAAPGPSRPGEDLPSEGQRPQGQLWKALLWVLSPLLLILGAEGQRRLRLARRARLRNRGSISRRALGVWRELERLHRLLNTPAPEEARFLAEKAKYSRQGISREELEQLQAHRRAALAEMDKRPWYLKIPDRYIFAVC